MSQVHRVAFGVALLVTLTAACGGGAGEAATTTTAPVTTTAAATTTVASTTTLATSTTGGGTGTTAGAGDPLLEEGRVIFEETYLGDGCQQCHGLDARGTADGPDIRGVSRTKIVDALSDVEEMEWEVKLTSHEIDAVYAWVSYLSTLPEG